MRLFPVEGETWVVAHRGVSARVPENTAAAFELAIGEAADAVECDLRLTADDRVLIVHDAALDHYGHPGVRVRDTSSAEMTRLDAGSWFGPEFAGERFLSLESLLDQFGGRLPLYLELKSGGLDEAGKRRLVEVVVRALERRTLERAVAMLAFEPDVLCCLRRAAEWATLVLNVDEPQTLLTADTGRVPTLAGVDTNIDRLTEADADWIAGRGLVRLAYTCNTPEQISKARRLGVQALITDDPRRTRGSLRGTKATS